MKKVEFLAENASPAELEIGGLPPNCHTVVRDDGIKDLVLAERRVDIFDLYHDLGIKLKRIDLSSRKS